MIEITQSEQQREREVGKTKKQTEVQGPMRL